MESLRNGDEALDVDGLSAYNATSEVFNSSLTKHEIAKYYDKWAENGKYDAELNPSLYKGPECVARAISTNYSSIDRRTARILDVAAGTGKLGAELYRLGFRNIDALDPSNGMLDKARKRCIYTNFINDFIGKDNPVPVEDNAYDGLAVVGGFGAGHIPCSALSEMIRIVRPGGTICISIRAEYLDCAKEYKDTLEPFMQTLERNGKWKLQLKDTIIDYAFGKPGLIFQYIT